MTETGMGLGCRYNAGGGIAMRVEFAIGVGLVPPERWSCDGLIRR